MDALRISLIIIGILIIAAIYWWGRRASVPSQKTNPVMPMQAEVAEADLQSLGNIIPDREIASPAVTAAASEAAKPAEAADVLFATTSGEQLILSLTIIGHQGRRFTGEAIVQAMRELAFEHGEMRIFHYFDASNKRTPLMSVANILEPGVFDLDKLRTFDTPGLVVFMKLPGPLPAREAFDLMLSNSKALADALHGDLCDESRSVLTPQTIGYLREKIEAFRFKQKMAELGAKDSQR